MHDVIIVGGGYAGLSAALQLGRARRDVLVIDAGARRNRFASHAHGFLANDGVAPDVIAAKGREDVRKYPTVGFRDAKVTDVHPITDGFAVHLGDEVVEARRLVIATGVVDELPEIPGLRERWGRSVFHCPYCHGYELDRGRIGVLATNPMAGHYVQLVAEWSTEGGTTLFTNDAFAPDEATRAHLAARGIRIEPARVTRVDGETPAVTVHLGDGRTETLAGLFVMPGTHVPTLFAERLGCALETGPTGSFFRTDGMAETSVPGVFACGDVARVAGAVAFAVAEGMLAGTAAHRSLVFGLASSPHATPAPAPAPAR